MSGNMSTSGTYRNKPPAIAKIHLEASADMLPNVTPTATPMKQKQADRKLISNAFFIDKPECRRMAISASS
uniref:Uncharacterized protein n=1 Tax=Arion vulgaris TaxID=1028688 RepID=A0A0B6ZE86_9EUPU